MFKGKAAVVTGGAMGEVYILQQAVCIGTRHLHRRAASVSYTGIGAATVKRLIKEGASVVIADISADAGTALAAELGSHAAFVNCDVRHVCYHLSD